jgi:REP element-mobilizing transposase RayT
MSSNKGYRCVYLLNIHLVLVTKYRKKIINQEILKRLHEILASTCEKWDSKLTDFNGEPDHVHLVIDFPPGVGLVTAALSPSPPNGVPFWREYPALWMDNCRGEWQSKHFLVRNSHAPIDTPAVRHE